MKRQTIPGSYATLIWPYPIIEAPDGEYFDLQKAFTEQMRQYESRSDAVVRVSKHADIPGKIAFPHGDDDYEARLLDTATLPNSEWRYLFYDLVKLI